MNVTSMIIFKASDQHGCCKSVEITDPRFTLFCRANKTPLTNSGSIETMDSNVTPTKYWIQMNGTAEVIIL